MRVSGICAWYLDCADVVISADEESKERTGDAPPKEPKKLNFFTKFFELQILMLQHNAGLTASHPYASGPINWPFLISGISFWTQSEGQKQIYLIGNLVGWWTCVIGLSLYTGIMLADLIARRRDIEPLTERESTSLPSCRSRWLTAGPQRCATVSSTRRASSSSSGRCTTSPSS